MLVAPALAFGQSAIVRTAEVQAQLVAHAPEGVAPGKPVWLGLLIQHAPHWHTYWKNPGDSGLPTTLSWTLPQGVSAGAIEWPTPQRLPFGPLVNYGYEGALLLPVPILVADGFHAPSLDVKLRADWLVCKDVCIPQSGEFSLSVPATPSTASHSAEFANTQAALPRKVGPVAASAQVDKDALAIDVRGLPRTLQGRAVHFFPEDAGVIDHAAAIEQRWTGDRLALRIPLSPQRSEAPSTMNAVISVAGESSGVALNLVVTGWPAADPASKGSPAAGTVAQASDPRSAMPLLLSLAFAFLGGLLLNLMPCVFPVLSLKVIGFAQHANDRAQLAAGGIAYSVGVVLSFLALAATLLALRAAGDQLGWGFQLQSPLFVSALALLFLLIGLNLLGVFEVRTVLPCRLATLRARHPLVDHALTGVLAVGVASPCTAPFMGAALGAALTQPPAQALAVFGSLGLGMAAPYLAMSLWPAAVRWLPRPGVWMVQFKTVMAFPMFATVVWLVWVLGQQVGVDGVAALLGVLVAVAFAAWVHGSVGLGKVARVGLGVAALGTLAAVALWAWPALQETPASTAAADDRWSTWSHEAVAKASADARPVFVDFTAAWCVTCQVNKRLTLGDEAVLADFRSRRVVLLRADWTRRDPDITRELTRLGRTGVPVYALYAPGAAEPVLLSELLTVREVRDAMARWQSSPHPVPRAAMQPRPSTKEMS